MRVLNKKQKNFIDKWLETVFNDGEQVHSIDDMPVEMQQELERMNDHETLWSNADRYINDKVLEKMYGR